MNYFSEWQQYIFVHFFKCQNKSLQVEKSDKPFPWHYIIPLYQANVPGLMPVKTWICIWTANSLVLSACGSKLNCKYSLIAVRSSDWQGQPCMPAVFQRNCGRPERKQVKRVGNRKGKEKKEKGKRTDREKKRHKWWIFEEENENWWFPVRSTTKELSSQK